MKYFLIALAVLVVLALVWFLVTKANRQRLDAQRIEAERLRAAADERQAALEGQRAFAEQARQRAEQARAEADEQARMAEEQARAAALAQEQADDLAAEAGRHDSFVSEGESDVADTLRQADEIDPSVDTSDAASSEVDQNELASSEGQAEEPTRSATRGSDEVTDPSKHQWSSEDVASGRGFGDPVGDEVADTSSGLSAPAVIETADTQEANEAGDFAEAEPSFAPETQAWGRRISDLEEISDGGYGMGSASPLSDGAQPLGHPVQAYRDTMTYRTEDAPGYDSAEPDVWFLDAEAAQRAGFQPAE